MTIDCDGDLHHSATSFYSRRIALRAELRSGAVAAVVRVVMSTGGSGGFVVVAVVVGGEGGRGSRQ